MARTRYRVCDNPHPHFLTCTICGWAPIFTRPETVQVILDSWRFLQDAKDRFKTDREHQFWQEGSHPLIIQSDEMMRQKLGLLGDIRGSNARIDA